MEKTVRSGWLVLLVCCRTGENRSDLAAMRQGQDVGRVTRTSKARCDDTWTWTGAGQMGNGQWVMGHAGRNKGQQLPYPHRYIVHPTSIQSIHVLGQA